MKTNSLDPIGTKPPETMVGAQSTLPSPKNRNRTFIVPAVLLIIYLAQCAWFIGTQSLTVDEPIDIISGLDQWRTGQFSGGRGWNDHPPLARLICTLPAVDKRFQILERPEGAPRDYPNGDRKTVLPSPESMAWHARPMNAVLGAMLGLLLWFAARSLYSVAAANFVLALFAFSPALIAHFSLGGTNDGAMALMTFGTVFQLYRWRRNPSRIQTLLLGLAIGGFLIAKASSLPLVALVIGLVLILKPGTISWRPSQWNWKHAAAALAISFLVIWVSYRFHVSRFNLDSSNVRLTITIPNRPDPIVYSPSRTFRISIPVPAYEYIQGVGYQIKHNRAGHPAFLLGRRYIGGSKLYFPIVVLLKWPTSVLLLCVAALVMIARRHISLPSNFALWAIFPALYFLLAIFARINLGDRYILPVYPFALLLCGSLWELTKGRRAVLALLVLALAVHVGDVMRYAPDYLSYFNLFVRPANSYNLLSDSNVDWGEGLIALRNYQREHPSEIIHLAYGGTVDPVTYGIRAVPLMPNQRISGTVVISANYLSGQTLPDPNGYQWVLQYPRRVILNHSLYVFDVPAQNARSEQGKSSLLLRLPGCVIWDLDLRFGQLFGLSGRRGTSSLP